MAEETRGLPLLDLASTYFSRQEVEGGEKTQEAISDQTGALSSVMERQFSFLGNRVDKIGKVFSDSIKNLVDTTAIVNLQEGVPLRVGERRVAENGEIFEWLGAQFRNLQTGQIAGERPEALYGKPSETEEEIVEENLKQTSLLSRVFSGITNLVKSNKEILNSNEEALDNQEESQEKHRSLLARIMFGETEKEREARRARKEKPEKRTGGVLPRAKGMLSSILGFIGGLLLKGGLLALLFGAFKALDNPELKASLIKIKNTVVDKLIPAFTDLIEALAPIASDVFQNLVENLSVAFADVAGGLNKILEGDFLSGFKQALVGENGDGGLVNSVFKFVLDSIDDIFKTNFQYEGLGTFFTNLGIAIENWIMANIPEPLRKLVGVTTEREKLGMEMEEIGSEIEDLQERLRREPANAAALQAQIAELQGRKDQLQQQFDAMSEFDFANEVQRELARDTRRQIAMEIQQLEDVGFEGEKLDELRRRRDAITKGLEAYKFEEGPDVIMAPPKVTSQGAEVDVRSRDIEAENPYANVIVTNAPTNVQNVQTTNQSSMTVTPATPRRTTPSPQARDYSDPTMLGA